MAKKIYLLEDDQAMRDVVTILLEDENYQVEAFASVSEFMRRDNHHLADLFILDVMPDGHGIDVCSLLKNNESTRQIPVLMMSVDPSSTIIEQSCTAQGFMAKPFHIDSLLAEVAASLQ